MTREEMLAEGKKIQKQAEFDRMGTDTLSELQRIDDRTDDAMHELFLRYQAAQNKK